MFNDKISNYLELGPGKVLTGLNGKILAGENGILASSIEKYESIAEVTGEYDG